MNSNTLITSSSNQIIKLARSLHHKKKRDEEGLFLVEGIHLVGSVFEADWEVNSIIFSPELLKSDYSYQLIRKQEKRGVKTVQVTSDLFVKLADKENPQGILAIVHQRDHLLEDLDIDSSFLGVAVVSPQDPGNIGTIIRTMDGAGADGLFLLDGGVDPYHPSCIRAGMGSTFWKPVIQCSFMEMALWAGMNQISLIGSSASAELKYQILPNIKKPVIILLGSEQKGLSKEQMDACDQVVSLPMLGRTSSLNLSVAAGILMYAMISKE